MTIDELVAAFSLGAWAESERLEWKESTRNLKEIVRTVASFANAAGGVVACGGHQRVRRPALVLQGRVHR